MVSEPPPKKRRHGQNKHRPRAVRIDFSEMLCPSLHDMRCRDIDHTCPYGDKCRYTHNTATFMMSKPADIGDSCYMFDKYGLCLYGPACRYSKSHVTKEFLNVVKEGVEEHECAERPVSNTLSKQLQIDLRKRRVQFERSNAYLERLGKGKESGGVGGAVAKNGIEVAGIAERGVSDKEGNGGEVSGHVGEGEGAAIQVGGATVVGDCASVASGDGGAPCGSITDEGDIKLRPSEKRKMDFRGKLYLAPLTTASL